MGSNTSLRFCPVSLRPFPALFHYRAQLGGQRHRVLKWSLPFIFFNEDLIPRAHGEQKLDH